MVVCLSRTILVSLAISLALTLILETGFYLLFGKRNKKDLLLVIMVNVLTNPVVVLLYWLALLYTNWDTSVVLIPLEVSAVVVEGCYFWKYGLRFRRPFLFSIAANAFSFIAGAGLNMLL